jgi:hypothetical protein
MCHDYYIICFDWDKYMEVLLFLGGPVFKMNNPTCDEWYQLGMKMCHISSNWRKIYHEMVPLFGQSNTFTKLLDNIISKKLLQLKNDLDDQINDVNPVGVFYSLNNGICYSNHKYYDKRYRMLL